MTTVVDESTSFIPTSKPFSDAAADDDDEEQVRFSRPPSPHPESMALFRGLRRRLRQSNPCTAFLVIVFLAVVIFLVSSARSNSGSGSPAAVGADGAAPGSDRRRLSGLGGGADQDDDDDVGSRQRHGRRHPKRRKGGSFIVGDEEVQICLMTPRWSKSVVADERQPEVQQARSAGRRQQCDGPAALFNVDQAGVLRVNRTSIGRRSIVDCTFREIRWKTDKDYEFVDVQSAIDKKLVADFLLAGCRLKPEANNAGTARRVRRELVGSSAADVGQSAAELPEPEEVARHMHRRVVNKNAPGLFGSVGLPDPSGQLFDSDGNHVDLLPSELPSKTKKRKLEPDDEHRIDGGGQADADANAGGDHRPLERPSTSRAAPKEEIRIDDGQPEQESKDDLNNIEQRHRDVDGPQDQDNRKSQTKDEQDVGGADDDDDDELETVDQFIVGIRPVDDVSRSPGGATGSRRPNVLVLAIDSMSAASFVRNLPLTERFLVDRLKAVVMGGYNVLGDAAPSNIIPLLTGRPSSDYRSIGVSGELSNFVDSLPFVWNKFEQAGYVTLYAEDQPDLGTFQLDFNGFEQPPVNHYMRPFWQAAADFERHRPAAQPRRRGCLGSTPEHEYLLHYVEQFFVRYAADVPRFAFAFFGNDGGSGDPSTVDGDRPADWDRLDGDLSAFLRGLDGRSLLDETVVVVVGDHGPSYGLRRQTELGGVEERQPLLAVALPGSMRQKYPGLVDALTLNRDRLTTALDVHETLIDLLDVDRIGQDSFVDLTNRTAISLLRPIPIQRTCRSAGIDIHWCMCTYFERADVSGDVIDKQWTKAAEFVVTEINEMLKPAGDKCARLKVDLITSAKYIIPSDVVLDADNRFYYDRELKNFTRRHPSLDRHLQIVVQTTPHGATFEATVVLVPATGRRRISGQISRVNAYGTDSSCVLPAHPELRKYCTCVG